VLGRASLYWHTLRYLRPIQIGARLRARLGHSAPDTGPAPAMRAQRGTWSQPARRRPSMLGPLTFLFLQESRLVAPGPWTQGPDALWTYNLNYFDDLNAFAATERREWHATAISTWLQHNPPLTGTGWAPYPTSLRVVNWIKYALGGARLGDAALASLAVQARALEPRLEYHLLGNHLFANAKALVFAGLFFEGAEADRWLDKGLSVLEVEIPEQILADGGQFERSPMYHALALEDVLDLVNITSVFPGSVPARWQRLVDGLPALAQRMHGWLQAMCHPDGEIALFNDAAIGIAPSPAEIERYAAELLGTHGDHAREPGARLRNLAPSGYVRVERPDAVLILDVAPIGPDYQPGHAHADTLSFELSVFGRRLIVNGGTSHYGTGPEREAERGTPAHSTVTVDGENSSEVWAGFRVARRARPFDLVVTDGARTRVSCAHDGYFRLPGRPAHRRVWELADRSLCVRDVIEGNYTTAVARFHLHPDVLVTADAAGGSGSLHIPSGGSILWRAAHGRAQIVESTFAAEFGMRRPTLCLEIELSRNSGGCLELAW
jgi:uncharacterized heparinase superfamily protein